jgi:hypothetical protein
VGVVQLLLVLLRVGCHDPILAVAA